jgi:hypothetical protein
MKAVEYKMTDQILQIALPTEHIDPETRSAFMTAFRHVVKARGYDQTIQFKACIGFSHTAPANQVSVEYFVRNGRGRASLRDSDIRNLVAEAAAPHGLDISGQRIALRLELPS